MNNQAKLRAAASLLVILLTVCGQTRSSEIFLDPMFDVAKQSDIVYGTGSVGNPASGQIDLLLDVYQPSGQGVTRPRPGIVLVHGGGFQYGHKSWQDFPRLAEEYAKRGYLAVSIDYRLRGDDPTFESGPWDNSGWTARAINAAIQDAAQAVRWMRDNATSYAVDPSRIALAGESAGAITSLFLGYEELGSDAEVGAVIEFYGGMYGLESAIDADDPPLFIVHGTEDDLVPFSLAEEIVTQAQAVGLPFEFHALEGREHNDWGEQSIWNEFFQTEFEGTTLLQKSVNFLYEHLDVQQLAQRPMLEAGDADQDLDFDQFDLVRVQQAGKYFTGQAATWGEGDWNGAPGGSPGYPPPGDGVFNQFDIVAAQQAAKYFTGPYAADAPVAVPEASSFALLGIGALALAACAHCRGTRCRCPRPPAQADGRRRRD